MSTKAWKSKIRVDHCEYTIGSNNGANVSDLPAAFCIKRRVINKHFNLIVITIDDGKNSPLSNVVNITHKLGDAV